MFTKCVKMFTNCVKMFTDCVKMFTKCVKMLTKCVKMLTKCVRMFTKFENMFTKCVKMFTKRVKRFTKCAIKKAIFDYNFLKGAQKKCSLEIKNCYIKGSAAGLCNVKWTDTSGCFAVTTWMPALPNRTDKLTALIPFSNLE